MSTATLDPERLLSDSGRFLDEAHKAYLARNLARAEEYLFLAADRLEQLIVVSPPGLVEPRLKTIEEIGDFIEQIQA